MLIVCSQCQRHHRSPEACPFCARRKRRTLAAVAASLVVGACASEAPPVSPADAVVPTPAASAQSPTDAPVVVVPEIEPSEEPVAVEEPGDDSGDASDETDAESVDAPDEVAEVEPAQPDFQRPMVMRYGIAPRPAPPKPPQPPKKP